MTSTAMFIQMQVVGIYSLGVEDGLISIIGTVLNSLIF